MADNLKIKTVPDPILKQKAQPIKNLSQEIEEIGRAMLKLMEELKGVGLAAPQVGLALRLIVIGSKEVKNPKTQEIIIPEIKPMILINPEIKKYYGEEIEDEEGCLSVPNTWGLVPRFSNVEVKAFNEKGETLEIDAVGFLARLLQHEIDHLEGILFFERVRDLSSLHKIDQEGKRVPLDDLSSHLQF